MLSTSHFLDLITTFYISFKTSYQYLQHNLTSKPHHQETITQNTKIWKPLKLAAASQSRCHHRLRLAFHEAEVHLQLQPQPQLFQPPHTHYTKTLVILAHQISQAQESTTKRHIPPQINIKIKNIVQQKRREHKPFFNHHFKHPKEAAARE